MHYVDVILPLPLEGTFTYSVPEPMVVLKAAKNKHKATKPEPAEPIPFTNAA